MEDAQQSHSFSKRIEMVLRREALLASGRKDAIQFAWDCKGDLPALKAEVQETEELISAPERTKKDMAPGTTPRIYREAYLAGLKDVIDIISTLASKSDAPGY